MGKFKTHIFLFVLIFLISCSQSENESDDSSSIEEALPTIGFFSTEADAGFYDAPFPSEHMRRTDGTIKWGLLPNPENNPITQHYIDQADLETNGFSRAGAIYIPFSGPINETNIPSTIEQSLSTDAKVFLVNVTQGSPGFGARVPFHAKWQQGQTPYINSNTLILLPYQGYPLDAESIYAAVVLTTVQDVKGAPLGVNDLIATMAAGDTPPGEFGAIQAGAFKNLWRYCDFAGLDRSLVATAAVFRTGDFVTEMQNLQKAVAALPDPAPFDLKLLFEYDTFYVVEGKMIMPIWQDGQRPYWTGGGRIHFDESGKPILQWYEEIRFAVSVPKERQMPKGGFPLLFYANGQGGKYTQVFDRSGVGENKETPGTGPALEMAHRGIGCLDIEAPLSGPRHPASSYSGLEFFNFWNLVAFRDNIRQAASEFSYLLKMVKSLSIPASLVSEAESGGEDITFDPGKFYLWGHSTGGSIIELTLAFEPGFAAGMLSGAGVSWIYNLIYKQEPFPLQPVFALLSGAEELDEFHPLATIFQNICDPVEAAYFARHWYKEPLVADRSLDLLLIMGVFDKYFPPLMIDGLTVAAWLDLAEPVGYEPTLDALDISGRSAVPVPAFDNITQGKTGLVAQYIMGEEFDAHHAAFVLPECRYQYSCFFGSHAHTGTATLYPAKSDPFADCGYE